MKDHRLTVSVMLLLEIKRQSKPVNMVGLLYPTNVILAKQRKPSSLI